MIDINIMTEDTYYQLDTGDFVGEKPTEYYKFKYEPDHFQLHGFKAIDENEDILVTAHTGAGKTCLAIYAIAKWLNCNNSQIVYCSPIKALSNQKHLEFKNLFDVSNDQIDTETSNIGILTGDVKINTNAKVVIMTAEILRNALLKKSNNIKSDDYTFNTDSVKCVILDEVHFINNEERGNVWEEIITNLSPNIQLVMLSATINGADKLAKWVGNLRKIKCHLIPTAYRPVPLHHYLYDYTKQLIWKENTTLKSPLNCILNKTEWKEGSWQEVFHNIEKYKKITKKTRQDSTVLFDCIKYSNENSMLPVNVFILNREYLEKLANSITIKTTDHEEQKEIDMIWNNYLLKYKNIYECTEQWNKVYRLAMNGIGIHHSGIIPILKEIVEILYEKKLIKILLATETFAMGVNMPTKTVIFYKTSKFDGKGKRDLKPAEYIQMAGRAGRRGLDDFGNVIIIPDKDLTNSKDENRAKKMIKTEPEKLKSRLQIDFSFILKRMIMLYEDSLDKSIVPFISENVSNTLFSIEETNKIESELVIKRNEYNMKIEYINKIESEVSRDIIDLYIKLIELNNNINPKSSDNGLFGFTIKQGDKKRIEKEIKKIKEKINTKMLHTKLTLVDFEKYLEYSKDKEDIPITENELIKTQTELILKYLEEFNMVQYSDKFDYILTPLGRIVAEVNECNPLLMGYIIENNMLDDLEFGDIIGILSILIADFTDENSETCDKLDDLNTSDIIKSNICDIFDYIEKLEESEIVLMNELPYTFKTDWNISLSIFNITKLWAKDECSWVDVKHIYFKVFSFEGNFCRNILRIVNLLKNIESIAVMTNRTKLLNNINGYEGKLIRDIVTTDSLYI